MFKLNPKVDDVIEKCGCVGPDGVKLAVMGTIDTGGSGCMCPEPAFLRALLRHVILREKDLVIMDMEADLAGKSPLDVGGPGIEAIKEIKVKLEELFGKMAKEEAAKGGKVV
jgi:hypothetical protein